MIRRLIAMEVQRMNLVTIEKRRGLFRSPAFP